MILELDQVTAVVGAQTHLYPTSLRLAPGAINVLLGPTQAGKTTLMRIMAGLDRPTTVSYTHLTLPTIIPECRSRWSPYH